MRRDVCFIGGGINTSPPFLPLNQPGISDRKNLFRWWSLRLTRVRAIPRLFLFWKPCFSNLEFPYRLEEITLRPVLSASELVRVLRTSSYRSSPNPVLDSVTFSVGWGPKGFSASFEFPSSCPASCQLPLQVPVPFPAVPLSVVVELIGPFICVILWRGRITKKSSLSLKSIPLLPGRSKKK